MMFHVQTYFNELTKHHRMLASLRDLADSSTRRCYEQQHVDLDKATCRLEDDAELEQRHLQRIIHQWEEFITVFARERDWLSMLDGRRQQASAVVSDTATLHELQRISSNYHDIQQAVANKTSLMMQVCIHEVVSLLHA